VADDVDKPGIVHELATSEALAQAESDAKAGAYPTDPLSPVNKITWAQVGRVAEPGRYIFKFGWLTITAEDLALWGQHPNAVFTLQKGYGDRRSRRRISSRHIRTARKYLVK
jgi:hypothetical protein